jgi:hypothetical protein
LSSNNSQKNHGIIAKESEEIEVEKKRVIQLGQRAEHLIIEENLRAMENGKIESIPQRPQLHSYISNEMNQIKDQQQNIWRSRLLNSGAHNQPWFDKLQDYRNEV